MRCGTTPGGERSLPATSRTAFDGSARVLEGIPEAFARHLSGGDDAGHDREREGPFPHPQSQDRKPGGKSVCRRRQRQACRGGGRGQRVSARRGRLRADRGRGAGGGRPREHPHDRHRDVRALRKHRMDLVRQAALPVPGRPGGRGGLLRHPRCDGGHRYGRDLPARALPARAGRPAGAARQGHRAVDAPLRRRGARPGRLFRQDRQNSGRSQADGPRHDADRGKEEALEREDGRRPGAGPPARNHRGEEIAEEATGEGEGVEGGAGAGEQRHQHHGCSQAERRFGIEIEQSAMTRCRLRRPFAGGPSAPRWERRRPGIPPRDRRAATQGASACSPR